MKTEHYNPVPFDVDATRARWMKRKGFAAAYAALADEYAALRKRLTLTLKHAKARKRA